VILICAYKLKIFVETSVSYQLLKEEGAGRVELCELCSSTQNEYLQLMNDEPGEISKESITICCPVRLHCVSVFRETIRITVIIYTNVINEWVFVMEAWCIFCDVCTTIGRLCGLVVRIPAYRSRGPGSIPDATTFSEK
jgi:hypothetical protein